jgi:hypothetical protein
VDMGGIIKVQSILRIFTLESHPTIEYQTVNRNLYSGARSVYSYVLVLAELQLTWYLLVLA